MKTLYLHYHNAYGHQTGQDSDLSGGAPTHKVTWPFDHVILRNQVTNVNYISTTTVPVHKVTKVGNIMTYIDGSLGIKLKIGGKLKSFYLPYHIIYGQ